MMPPHGAAVRRLLPDPGMPPRHAPFARKVSRTRKARSGRTRVSETPLRVLVSGVALSADFGPRVRALLGRRLGRFATHIEKAVVRVEDVSNQRGGASTVCRIKLTVSGRPTVLVERRGADAEAAFALAAAAIAGAIERSVGRARMPTPGATRPEPSKRPAKRSRPAARPEGGSLIGRRVGRSEANLRGAARRPRAQRDAWIDTAAPGVSETDRRAGGGSTAARNTKLRASGMGYTLEDSAEKPSRKSTRKSANRAKSGSKLARKARRKTHSPKARATRARVRQ
jgi:hypothetical protein